MKLRLSKEFIVGKHQIGLIYGFDLFKDETFEQCPMPSWQELQRKMTDAQIETELKPGICTPGDVLAFLDNAPEECKDGKFNLFYLPSCVVYVFWFSDYRYWVVRTWYRDGNSWDAGNRVFSPATGARKLGAEHSDTLTFESLAARVEALEAWKNKIQGV